MKQSSSTNSIHQNTQVKVEHTPSMKTSTILASVALLFASAVTAQTACDSVASAVPTCGVSSLRPSHRILPFSHSKLSLALPNQPFSLLLLSCSSPTPPILNHLTPPRYPASPPRPSPSGVTQTPTAADAAAPTQSSPRPLGACWARADWLQLWKCRLVRVRCVRVLRRRCRRRTLRCQPCFRGLTRKGNGRRGWAGDVYD